VRVQIVWSQDPGLTVPVAAVSRITGRFFVFVAEAGEGGALVARQRAVTLGPIVGSDYLVESGLQAGDRLSVGGLQKIGDGAPVSAMPPGGRGPDPAAAGAGAGRGGD
jgi:multidrug efflux pump subunit AcrA (membrane-fusion protein)